jgi:hypothetical protein
MSNLICDFPPPSRWRGRPAASRSAECREPRAPARGAPQAGRVGLYAGRKRPS